MICPKCRRSNLNTSKKCICGYVFANNLQVEEKRTDPFSGSTVSGGSGNYAGKSARGAGKPFRSYFNGNGSDLFSIYIINILLIIVTFGVYYFWGKAKIKRYMYSQSEFDGDRFTFHGTGSELFKGGMIAIGFLIVYSLVSEYINRFIATTAGMIVSSFIGILFLFAVAAAIVLSRRYYLSRTTWRGIRFSFRGGIRDFIALLFKGYLLTLITLGIYFPFFVNRYQEYMISNSYFGNQKFEYSGSGKEIFKMFLKYFFLATIAFFILVWFLVVSGGLSLNSTKAAAPLSFLPFIMLFFLFFLLPLQYFRYWIAKYKWNSTSFLGAGFNLAFSFSDYIKLKSVNALILLFSLGLGWPWVAVRNARFFTRYLSLDGVLDFEVVKQKMIDTSATGESVADIFDIDAGLDIGI